MEKNGYKGRALFQTLEEVVLEASPEDLKEAFAKENEDYNLAVQRSREALKKALEISESSESQLEDLHRGLGSLVMLLRKKEKLTVTELSSRARISAEELLSIETNSSFEPEPRTITQLEGYFSLKPKSLAQLSGLISSSDSVREEAVKFAACAEGIMNLTKSDKQLMNAFVDFLSKQVD